MKVYNTEYKYNIDFGNGVIRRAKTLNEALIIVKNEVYRTIVPRYQNDIIVKNINGDIIATLPWIGIQSDDNLYWITPSKILPPTYGNWIMNDEL